MSARVLLQRKSTRSEVAPFMQLNTARPDEADAPGALLLLRGCGRFCRASADARSGRHRGCLADETLACARRERLIAGAAPAGPWGEARDGERCDAVLADRLQRCPG